MFTDFFQHKSSLSIINHTHIALIPKSENPEMVTHFRPISLCNVSYKIISKILVNRLRPLLAKCISQNQGAFAPGKSIFDNILIAHELFSNFGKKKGRRGDMAIKLDLEKAYDFLHWDYIKHCLAQFGFANNWIDLIMECITSVQFSLLINGKPQPPFKPLRGLRQGDPLSPYIFILCMEPLIRKLNMLASNTRNQVGILSSPCGIRVSNLMFADDCLIFSKANTTAARHILKTLDSFSKASGEQINYHKSTIYFSNNVPNACRFNLSCILSIQHKATIGKYLGIHNVVFWKDSINTNDLILKMQNKLAGWKANTLSCVLKANFTGMPNHVLSCFNCSSKVTSALDKECRKFFWGNEMKTPPIAWSAVCTPNCKGGLGIRPYSDFNKAALAKLGWKILTDPNNWWVQIMHAKYLRKNNFFSVKKNSRSSMAWKGILNSRDLLSNGMRWIVGNGSQINFWCLIGLIRSLSLIF